MGAGPEVQARIERRQLGLSVGAVAAAVPGLLFGLDSYYGGFFILTMLPLTLPPLLGRSPRVFAQACVIIALALVTWSVMGAVPGMYLFLPSAALLLLAAATGPRRSTGTARLLGWAGVLVLAGVAAGTAVWCWTLYDGSPPAAAHDGALRTHKGQGRIQQ
ncbi:hypothetical protein [Streptomyces sp. NPDC026673]|uniref:hypothetical protein n=1 Tax=Streptomyces sp. NPDC026673 TaxID=3155724 RepID=UPI0033CAADCA